MEQLWIEIRSICKNIMSYSLDLIYDSFEVVLEKLKIGLKNYKETGFEDIQLSFFLKYISIPETLNKALEDQKSKEGLLSIFEEINQILTEKHLKDINDLEISDEHFVVTSLSKT